MTNEEIISILEYISGKLGETVDFTKENVMPYAEKILAKYCTYKIISGFLGVLISVGLFFVCFYVTKLIGKQRKKALDTKTGNLFYDYYSWGVDPTLLVFFVATADVIVILCCLIAVICNGTTILEWSVTPEIALLKEIKYILT